MPHVELKRSPRSSPDGFSALLQIEIKRPSAEAAAVHRPQLDVADRIEAVAPRNPLADDLQDAFDEMEVAGRILHPFRHQLSVDAVRIDDDAALGRLPEHLGQPYYTAALPFHRCTPPRVLVLGAGGGHGIRAADVGEHLAGADGRRPIDVADRINEA